VGQVDDQSDPAARGRLRVVAPLAGHAAHPVRDLDPYCAVGQQQQHDGELGAGMQDRVRGQLAEQQFRRPLQTLLLPALQLLIQEVPGGANAPVLGGKLCSAERTGRCTGTQ